MFKKILENSHGGINPLKGIFTLLKSHLENNLEHCRSLRLPPPLKFYTV